MRGPATSRPDHTGPRERRLDAPVPRKPAVGQLLGNQASTRPTSLRCVPFGTVSDLSTEPTWRRASGFAGRTERSGGQMFRERRDGTRVENLPGLRRIIPYLMRSRSESVVYFPQRIEVEQTLRWLDRTNQGRSPGEHVTLFHVLMTAIVRTLWLRPELNRFIVGRRTYQHPDISISFVVKTAMTEDAPEAEVRVTFTGQETMDQVRDRVDTAVDDKRGGGRGPDDELIDFLAGWPRPILDLVARAVRAMDDHNALPEALRSAIPLYTSAYVVNVGSLGIDPPFHHLYELGSASVFVSIGAVSKQAVVDDEGRVVARDCLDLVYTLDERASEGFYFARTAQVFQRLVADPQLLQVPHPSVEEILAGWPHRSEHVPWPVG